jgi:hypothetical protein
MSSQLTLDQANAFTVMLVQATQGAISSNFRLVALSLGERIWTVRIVLEHDDPQDLEEARDIVEEFDALICGYTSADIALEQEILVSSTPLPALAVPPWRVVFRRRE